MFVVHLFKNSSNSRRKDLERVRTNTQVSDMRIWHVDTSARLLAIAAHEMQTFLRELRKLKKCQRTFDTNFFSKAIDNTATRWYFIVSQSLALFWAEC